MKNNLRIRDHVKSWDEIRKASAFSKRWKGARDGLPCCTGVKNRSVGDVAKGGIAHAYDCIGNQTNFIANAVAHLPVSALSAPLRETIPPSVGRNEARPSAILFLEFLDADVAISF